MELPWAQMARMMRASRAIAPIQPLPAASTEECEAKSNAPINGRRMATLAPSHRMELLTHAVSSDPANPQSRLALARLQHQQGESERALEHYLAVLDKFPGDAELRSEIVRRYVEQGDYRGALAVLPKYGQPNPTWKRYRAILYLLIGDPLAALKAYPAEAVQSGELESRLEYAALACLADRWEAAEPVLSTAVTDLGANPEIYAGGAPPALFHLWALTAAQRGDLRSAIERLRTGRKVARSGRLDRFLVTSLLELAEHQRQLGDLRGAIGYWDEAANIDASCKAAVFNRALGRLELCVHHFKRQDYATAKAVASVLLDGKTPYRGYALQNLGLMAENQGDWESALTYWSALLNVSDRPSELSASELRLRELRCLMHLRRWERMARTSAKLAEDETIGTKARCIQGAALLAAKRPADAVEVFSRCLLSEHDGLALRGLSLAFIQQADFEASADVLSQLIAQHPEDAWATDRWRAIIKARAVRAACLGDWNEAQMYYASMLLQNSQDAEAWIGSGGVHLLAGVVQDAEDSFQQALQLSKNRPRTHVQIGEHFLAAGDRRGAQRHFAQALAKDAAGTAYDVGILQLRVGDIDHALKSLRLAIKYESDPVRVLRHALTVVPSDAGVSNVVELIEDLNPRSLEPDLALLVACRHVEQSAWTKLESVLSHVQERLEHSQVTPLRDAFLRIRRISVLKRTLGEFDRAELEQLSNSLLELCRSGTAVAEPNGPPADDASLLVPDMARTLNELIPTREPCVPPEPYIQSGPYVPDRSTDLLDLDWWAKRLAPTNEVRRPKIRRARTKRPAKSALARKRG